MRVGIYDPYLDDLGGGEKYMMTIAECLSRNHVVTVFWDRQEDLEKLKAKFSLNLTKVKIEKNIFSKSVNFFKRQQLTKKYDALIILIDGSIPIVSSKKLFLHIQQPLSEIKKLSFKDNLKLKKVNKIFYNSQFTKSFNQNIFTNVQSEVVYPPVVIAEKNLKKENVITHVGRFRVMNVKNEDFKKQTFMVNTFKHMVDQGLKNWKFILATSINDVDEPNFLEMIKSAKGYPIEILVNKNNNELWNLYSRAKIYWHASGYGEDLNKHPEYAEHFGISTVEAMGAGVVPVVINAGGQKEIVTNQVNGLLWGTTVELIDKTNLLIKDTVFWKKMSDSAQKRAKDFSIEKFYNSVENLLQ